MLSFALLGLAFSRPIQPAHYEFARQIRSVTIPFTRMSNGTPVVEATVNGTVRARLMVDTGSNYTFVTDSLCKKAGLEMRPAIADDGKPIVNTWGPAEAVTLRTLQVGELTYRNSDILVQKSTRVSGLVGPGIDGAIGANALEKFPILFDWSERKLTVWGAGPLKDEDLRLVGMADAVAVPLRAPADGEPRYSVTARLNGTLDSDLLLDTGAGLTTIPAATARHLGIEPDRSIRKYPTFEGTTELALVRLKSLALGKAAVPDIEVGYSKDPRVDARTVSLGLDVLARFRMLMDVPGRKVYLKPYEPRVGTGIAADLTPDHRLSVAGVTPGSPAAAAGIEVGDEIVEVAGKSVAGLSPSQLGAELVKPAGAEITLKVRRKSDGSLREVRVRVGMLP